jgi:hypothetical protein
LGEIARREKSLEKGEEGDSLGGKRVEEVSAWRRKEEASAFTLIFSSKLAIMSFI